MRMKEQFILFLLFSIDQPKNLFPLPRLQSLQSVCKLLILLLPPLEKGTMWSISSSTFFEDTPQNTQRQLSLLKTSTRVETGIQRDRFFPVFSFFLLFLIRLDLGEEEAIIDSLSQPLINFLKGSDITNLVQLVLFHKQQRQLMLQ